MRLERIEEQDKQHKTLSEYEVSQMSRDLVTPKFEM